jgi:hypothetical protein
LLRQIHSYFNYYALKQGLTEQAVVQATPTNPQMALFEIIKDETKQELEKLFKSE